MRPVLRLSALAVTGLLALGACGGRGGDNSVVVPGAQTTTTVAPAASSTTAASSSPTTATAGVTTTTAAAAAATTTTTAAGGPVATINAKVNANTASQSDIAAAITAAGVSNGARWAIEVVEYRPYPTNDPTFAKLRQNLAKYNPGPGVVDGIISALTL